MPTSANRRTTKVFEDESVRPAPAVYVLRLCVSGMTPRSRDAIQNLRTICDEYLRGQYALEVIDIYQQPELAVLHDIVATPTLIKAAPAPMKRLLGSLRDIPVTLARLGILPAS